MDREIVIVGCGGLGREVFCLLRALDGRDGWRVRGFVDDAPSAVNLERVARLDVPYLGPTTELMGLGAETSYVIGVGAPRVRADLAGRIDGYGLPAATLVHPDSSIGQDNTFGPGTVIFAGVRLTTNVRLGRHTHINQNTSVGHDCDIDDYVSINPLVALSGSCHLATGVMVGTGAAILQGRSVGAWATVAASACVVRDVAPGSVVKGVPARPDPLTRTPAPVVPSAQPAVRHQIHHR